jgi:hypothetical protein
VRVLRGAFIELVGLYEGMSGERRVMSASDNIEPI